MTSGAAIFGTINAPFEVATANMITLPFLEYLRHSGEDQNQYKDYEPTTTRLSKTFLEYSLNGSAGVYVSCRPFNCEKGIHS